MISNGWAAVIVAFALGPLITGGFLTALRLYLRVKKPYPDNTDTRVCPAWLTGIFERAFFMTLVAFNVPGVSVAMIGWLTLKMVTNWNNPLWGRTGESDRVGQIRNAFAALLAGLVSMGVALVAGLIWSARWQILPQWIAYTPNPVGL